MKYKFLIFGTLIVLLNACKKSAIVNPGDKVIPITTSTSFYPMQIGNYWKTDAQNYMEIQDTVRINGKLYYKFHYATGGDVIGLEYLRIDENQYLVEANPNDTSLNYQANFGANVNDTFHSLNIQNINNHLIKVTYKSATKMTFQIDVFNNNFASAQTIANTYYKGIGPDGNYTTIKINGIVYNY